MPSMRWVSKLGVIQCPACSREPSNRAGALVLLGNRCKAVLRVARAHDIDGADVLHDRREMWLPMARFEDRYGISSRGRVRSLRTGRILKTPCTGKDYPQVELDGSTYRVHILMAETFLGPRPEGWVGALHFNDRKSDNRIANIRWGTYRENYADAVRNGRIRRRRPIAGPEINGDGRNHPTGPPIQTGGKSRYSGVTHCESP